MSNYPLSLDTDAELPQIIDNVSEVGAEGINAIRAAIFSLQRALGTSPNGSANSLAARLDQSLNSDGTLKVAALILTGIVNSDVALGAAISESKLDLDVATQYLQDQVTSNDVDIAQLQASIALIISNFARHVAGIHFRHDSYDIDLDSVSPTTTPPEFTSLSSINVGDALIEINDRFIDHASALKVGAHEALNISVSGVNFQTIPTTVDDVQEALEALDLARKIEIIKHRDHLHANGLDNWANNIDGYNSNLQLVPATYGTSFSAQIVGSTTNQVQFTALSLAGLGVVPGSVLVVLDGVGAGNYVIDDVGPRAGVGTKPLLASDSVELIGPIANASAIAGGNIEVVIYGESSVFTFKGNVSAVPHQAAATLDSMQMSRPNSARAVTLGIKPHLILGSEVLDIEVGVGAGLIRTISISDLDEDRAGPVSKVTVETIVDKINSEFQGTSAFPAAAYVVGNELCLSHNWDESREYHISILGSGTAQTVLGFDGYGAAVMDVAIRPTHSSKFYVGGYDHSAFLGILSDNGTANGTNVITLSAVNPLDAGVKVGHLFHILSHGTTTVRGTYFITAVSSSTVTLHTNVASGAVVGVVVHDAVPTHELANTTSSLTLSVYLNSAGGAAYNIRSTYDKLITNLDVSDVSDNFIAGSHSLTSTVTTGGHLLRIENGIEVFVPTGFVGQKVVYGESNVEFLVVTIFGALGSGSAQVDINEHIAEEEVLEVCGVMTNGGETLFYTKDKRLFGSIGQDEIREDVIQNYIESPLYDLRSDGVVRGFDVINSNEVDPVFPSNEGVLLRGGTAYVYGVRNDVRTSIVIIPNTAGTFIVCLTKLGTFEIVNASDFSLSDIIDGHAGPILPIVEVTHNGSSITSAVDRRFFINNLDAKVDIIADLTNHMVGSFATFEAAIAFANNYTASEKFFIRVASRTTDPLTIPTGSRDLTVEIDGYVGTIYANSNCKIRGRSLVDRGQTHASQGIFFGTGCEICELENLSIDDGIEFTGSSALKLTARNCTVDGVIVLNNSAMGDSKFFDCRILGGMSDVANPDSDITFADCSFVGNTVTLPQGTMNSVSFRGCSFLDTLLVSAGSTNLYVSNSTFSGYNSTTMMIDGGGAHTSISGCQFRDSVFAGTTSVAIVTGGETARISDSIFDKVTVPNSMELISLPDGGGISNCIFKECTFTSVAPYVISSANILDCSVIAAIGEMAASSYGNFSGNNGISQLVCAGSVRVTGNQFYPTTTFGTSVLSTGSSTITGNHFSIATNGIGVQLPAAGASVATKISNNHFQMQAATSVAVALLDSSNVLISENSFTVGIAFSTSAAIDNLTIVDNIVSGVGSSILVGDGTVVSGNTFLTSFAFGGGTATSVAVSGNTFKEGFNIGTALINSAVSNNRIEAGAGNDGYLTFSSDLTDTSVSGNNGIMNVPSSVSFTGVNFLGNQVQITNGGGIDTTMYAIVWRDSNISNNKILNLHNGSQTTSFTLYSTLSNDPSNVIISKNIINHNLWVTGSNGVVNVSVSENVAIRGGATPEPEIGCQDSVNYSNFANNIDFSIVFNGNIDNTIIMGNLASQGHLHLSALNVANTFVSSNICNTIEIFNVTSTAGGFTVSNNICYTHLKFCHSGNNTIDAALVTLNQTPQLTIGNEGTATVFNFITNSRFEGNICGALSIIPDSRVAVNSVFSTNSISNNQVSGSLHFLGNPASSNYNHASNIFSGNSFTLNSVGGDFSFYGGASPTNNVLILDTLVTGNRVRDSFLKRDYVSLTSFTFSSNDVVGVGNPGIVLSYTGLAGAATELGMTDIIMSGNQIYSSTGQGIVVAIPGTGLASTSRITRWNVQGNAMHNMDINITNSSSSSSAILVIAGLNVVGNAMRTLVIATNATVNVSLDVKSIVVANNFFSGDLPGLGLHGGATWTSGFFVLVDSPITGGSTYSSIKVSDNFATDNLENFKIEFRTTPNMLASKRISGLAITGNSGGDIEFVGGGSGTGFYLLVSVLLIDSNTGGEFLAGSFIDLDHGRINHGIISNNRFNLVDLPSINTITNTLNIINNNSSVWRSTAGGTFSTSGSAIVFPWANRGTPEATVVFGGAATRTVASTNFAITS